MAILAMDTATSVLAVAVGSDGQTLTSAASLVPRAHSRLLQPMAESLLDAAGMRASDLMGIAVGVGPGSYTGVRLGVTTAKAMATALGIPVFPASTLAVLAEAAVPLETRHAVPVMPLLYARRGRAFGGLYVKRGLGWQCLVPPFVLTYPEWGEILRAHTSTTGGCLVVHDLATHADAEDWLKEVEELQSAQLSLAHAAPSMGSALIRLAHRQELDCTPRYGEDVHALVPDYALRVEAEVKQGKGSVGGDC